MTLASSAEDQISLIARTLTEKYDGLVPTSRPGQPASRHQRPQPAPAMTYHPRRPAADVPHVPHTSRPSKPTQYRETLKIKYR